MAGTKVLQLHLNTFLWELTLPWPVQSLQAEYVKYLSNKYKADKMLYSYLLESMS